VKIKLLADAASPLVTRGTHRLHIGAQEHTVRVVFSSPPIAAGESGFCELRSQEPIVAEFGQRFILRRLSPVQTIGGGEIVDPQVTPYRRLRDLEPIAARLCDLDPSARLAAFLEHEDFDRLNQSTLTTRLGIDPANRDRLIERLTKAKELAQLPGSPPVVIHVKRKERLERLIVARVDREIRRRAPSRSVERSIVAHACRRFAGPNVVQALLERMLAVETLVRVGDKIGLPGRTAQLTKAQRATLSGFLKELEKTGLSPPLTADYAKSVGVPLKELETLVKTALEDELIVSVGPGYFASPAAIAGAIDRLIDQIVKVGPSTVAQLKDVWGISRKYAVPLCEYFDIIHVTKRAGDLRDLGPAARPRPTSVSSTSDNSTSNDSADRQGL
jgi:selenocysteine-specific elongation factor